ncbi:putative aldolase class 2 protein RP493 like protein [Argiope bruennichi]|uniref:Putative aldolase class 2 protein RP493 like protein n=1 Tax=Argiope bruennichi TaxID=94029 RepID=A0A8T0FGP5_ARGBR|nr:putative aldolase class 2 protein RP493 like protein [Argiope bruennichi]
MVFISFIRPCRSVIYRLSCSRNLSSVRRKEVNKEIRVRLASAYRALDSYGLNEGVCNHLSAIAPCSILDANIMLIIPFHLHWSEVNPSNLIEVNEKNEVLVGEGKPETTAFCIHQGVYKKRPDVKAIMHTHMPYATALTCLKNPKLLMLHQNSSRFYNRIAYDTEYAGLGDFAAEGERLGEALGQNSVLFMGNHGVLTAAESVDVAFDDMYYLERAAMVQVLACSTNQEVKEMDERVVSHTSQQILEVSTSLCKKAFGLCYLEK